MAAPRHHRRISRQRVGTAAHRRLSRQDLTCLGERTQGTHGKQATDKPRRANRHAAQWAFAELQG